MSNPVKHQVAIPPAAYALLTALGVVMILGGAGFILFAANIVYEVLYDPAASKVLEFVNRNVTMTDQVVSGNFDGKTFEIKMNEELRNFSLIFFALVAFSIVIGVFNSLILTGATLIKQSRMPVGSAQESADPPSKY